MQGQNISDVIEAYLKSILADQEEIEIRRSEIAERFNCVPSQINYVINTRFTTNNGYLVQSKRGGGGYIRIVKIRFVDSSDLLDSMIENIGSAINQKDALAVVQTLYDEDFINRRESNIILSVITSDCLSAFNSKKIENQLRAQLMISILTGLRYESES